MRTLVGLSRAGKATFDALLRVAETVSSAHPEAAIAIAGRTVDDGDAARTRRLETLHDEVGIAIKGDAPHSSLKLSSAAHCHTYPDTVERRLLRGTPDLFGSVSDMGEDTPICEFARSFLEVIEAPGSPAFNRRAMDFQQGMEELLDSDSRD